MVEKPSYGELAKRVKRLEEEVAGCKQLEKTLRNTVRRLNGIFNNVNDAVYIHDFKKDGKQGKFIEVNDVACKRLGYSREEYLSLSPDDLIDTNEPLDPAKILKDLDEKGHSIFETVHVAKNGGKIPVEISARVLNLGDRQFFVAISRDIMERKQAEEVLIEKEERYRSLVESTEDSIFLVDKKGRYLFSNKTHSSKLGIEHSEIIGKRYSEFHPEKDSKKFQERIEKVFKKGKSIQHVHKEKRNQSHFLRTLSPVKRPDGSISSITVISKDITNLKLAEAALQESLNNIKLFAYSVIHDLKNPAIGIYGLTKHLQEQCKDILDDRAKKNCDLIIRSAEQINNLVAQINVYILTKEVPLNIKKVNLKEVLQIVHDEFSNQINIRGLKWSEPEKIPDIRIDRLAVIRVLRNLIDNSLKYGGDELSEIIIKFRESSDYYTLSVSDDGIGIKEEDSVNIFQIFKRDKRSAGIEGAGLGLAIVKEIAEKHMGKVWAEPGKDRGMSFYIEISKQL
jgi:PAS domain S-box-containing protein